MANTGGSAIGAMEGQGFYNRHSSMQAAGNAVALDIWEKAARSVKFGDEPLAIADYGSSQGHNSMQPIATAIRILRERAGSDRAVQVIHTDLPSNDFASLFKALEEDPASYMARASGIFPSAIGRTYFEPLMPPETIHLGWNSWTIQWLSRVPVHAPDHIFLNRSASSDIRDAVSKQQALDWRLFLTLRAGELRPDGRLLSLFPGKLPDRTGWEWLTGELWEALNDMRRDGPFSDDEILRITVPTAPRSLADIHAPFQEDGGLFAGLAIEHAEILPGPDVHWKDFERTGDAAGLARSWTGMMRAFSAPTITNCLDPKRDRAALVGELYDRLAERIAANPQRHEHFIAVVLLHKL